MSSLDSQLFQKPYGFPSPSYLSLQRVAESFPDKTRKTSPYDIDENQFYDMFGQPSKEEIPEVVKPSSLGENPISVPTKSSDCIYNPHIINKRKVDRNIRQKSTARRFMSPEYKTRKTIKYQKSRHPIQPSPTFYISTD